MPITTKRLTPLESDIFSRFHIRFSQEGIPPANKITVKHRVQSTAGRKTYVEHDGLVNLPDGDLGLGQYSQFNMDKLEAGASFDIEIEDQKILYLSIDVNGMFRWDGIERNWLICDPDTGLFVGNG